MQNHNKILISGPFEHSYVAPVHKSKKANKISNWKYSPMQKIFKMSSVNDKVIGNGNGNDNDIANVNDDMMFLL